jgi:hypothetical protein
LFDDRQHYQQLYRSISPAFAFHAQTVEELNEWQSVFRQKLLETLGLEQMRQDLAGHRPKAEQVGIEHQDGYTREAWRLWTEPEVPLPFYLLRPASGGVSSRSS